MKGLKEELDELREIFRYITPETEEEYQTKFLSIQERYTSPEDVEAINGFMMSLYKVMDEKIEEIDRLLTIQEQLKPCGSMATKFEARFIPYQKRISTP